MMRRLWRRVYLDVERLGLWLDGSRFPVYLSKDGYVCQGLSLKQLHSIRVDDLPKSLLLKVSVPTEIVRATLYLDRSGIRLYISAYWDGWPYAVSQGEFIERLSKTLKNLGCSVRTLQYGVEATITCSGKLSPYLESLVNGLEDFEKWIFDLHVSRFREAERILEKVSKVDGRYLAALKGVSGIAKMLVASLTREDIAYLLLQSDEIRSIVFRKIGLDERDVYARLRSLGLYRRAGEGLQAMWPFLEIRRLTKTLYSSWNGEDSTVSRYMNAHYLLAYITRNLYPLIVKESRFGRDIRWRSGLKKFLEERLYPNLTLIDVAVTASLCLGIQAPLDMLEDSLETLKDLGILSHNLKPKPYATQITRLVKGYMIKTGLVKDRKQWENILGWKTLTNI